MSIQAGFNGVIHYPKRRDVFEFDDEVAAAFDDMAIRSIPLYAEVHRLHVSLLADRLAPGAVVVDVGSSTGHLFTSIERHFGQSLAARGLTGVAVDHSAAMMARLTDRFPTVTPLVADLPEAPDLPRPANVMFCLYTLQFIHPDRKLKALAWMLRNLAPNGALVLGQKEEVEPVFADLFDAEYYQFRRDNGYTQAEIDAKTAALKGSMWPTPAWRLVKMLEVLNADVTETTRWLHFSTLVCLRRVTHG